MKTAIELAIARVTPPTQAELARRIGRSPQVVNRWVLRGWVSARYAIDIERETGIPIHAFIADELRHAKR